MDFRTAADFGKISKKLENLGKGSFEEADTRFWFPAVDKAGNGYAVVRLLPTPEADGDEGVPMILHQKWGFQGPTGKWLIENCPVTIGEKCPIVEDNNRLWKQGEAGQEIVKTRKRNKYYFCNVLVIQDSLNPENEGRVFLMKASKAIYDLVQDAMNPKFPNQPKINPFDLINGANLIIKVYTEGGHRKYGRTSFENPSPLFNGDEDKMMETWKKAYSLQEFLDPSKFLSYNDLKKKFLDVIGEEDTIEETDYPTATKVGRVSSLEKEMAKELDNGLSQDEIPFTKPVENVVESDDDDEELARFRALAKGA